MLIKLLSDALRREITADTRFINRYYYNEGDIVDFPTDEANALIADGEAEVYAGPDPVSTPYFQDVIDNPDAVVVTGGSASTSVVTNNGDGTYTHDDGNGVSTVIDVRDGISGDAGNSLTLGSDGLPFAPAAASETVTSLSLAANILTYTDENGATTDLDISPYLDDTNLARLVSGTLDPAGIATFTRDDASTFTIDLSNLLPITAAAAISPASDDAVGAIGVATDFAREDHKHPAQGVSADAGNKLSVGSDGLHFIDFTAMESWQEYTRSSNFNASILANRVGTQYSYTGTSGADVCTLGVDTASTGSGQATQVLVRNDSAVSLGIASGAGLTYTGPADLAAGNALLVTYNAAGTSAFGYTLTPEIAAGGSDVNVVTIDGVDGANVVTPDNTGAGMTFVPVQTFSGATVTLTDDITGSDGGNWVIVRNRVDSTADVTLVDGLSGVVDFESGTTLAPGENMAIVYDGNGNNARAFSFGSGSGSAGVVVSTDSHNRILLGADGGAFINRGGYMAAASTSFTVTWAVDDEDWSYRGYVGTGGDDLTINMPPSAEYNTSFGARTYVPNNGAGTLNVVAGTGVTYSGPASIEPGEALILFCRPALNEAWGYTISANESPTAQQLAYDRSNLATSIGSAWVPGQWRATGVSVTLPAAGTYRVFGSLAAILASTNSNGGIYWRVINSTDNVALEETSGVQWGGSSATDNDAAANYFETRLTVTGPTQLDLQVQYQGSLTGLTVQGQDAAPSVVGSNTFLAYQQLPTHTYVPANALIPSDNFIRSGSFYSNSDGVESFSFDTPFDTSDGTTDADIEVFLQRKNQANIGIILAPQNITVSGFDVDRDNAIDGTGTSEPFSYVAFNRNNLAKTVINTRDIPVQNQENQVDGGILKWNATLGAYEPYSGFLADITEMGTGFTNNGPGSVTFATPQPDTNYRVFVQCIGGGNGQLVTVLSKTTTGFAVHSVDVHGNLRSNAFDWMIVR